VIAIAVISAIVVTGVVIATAVYYYKVTYKRSDHTQLFASCLNLQSALCSRQYITVC